MTKLNLGDFCEYFGIIENDLSKLDKADLESRFIKDNSPTKENIEILKDYGFSYEKISNIAAQSRSNRAKIDEELFLISSLATKIKSLKELFLNHLDQEQALSLSSNEESDNLALVDLIISDNIFLKIRKLLQPNNQTSSNVENGFGFDATELLKRLNYLGKNDAIAMLSSRTVEQCANILCLKTLDNYNQKNSNSVENLNRETNLSKKFLEAPEVLSKVFENEERFLLRQDSYSPDNQNNLDYFKELDYLLDSNLPPENELKERSNSLLTGKTSHEDLTLNYEELKPNSNPIASNHSVLDENKRQKT